MPKKFGKIVLASTGDHPKGKDEKIKNWVEHAGGTFVKDSISKDVTHLVCSEKAWKKYYPIGEFSIALPSCLLPPLFCWQVAYRTTS
jgi:NAD-dependent DNA ligase